MSKWSERAQALAAHIPANATVLELGAGDSELANLMPADLYGGSDKVPGKGQVALDLDSAANKWPEVHADIAVMLGVLEYVKRPDTLFKKLHQVADSVLLTYDHKDSKSPRANLLSKEELKAQAEAAGWTAEIVGAWRAPLVGRQLIWRLG